MLFVRVELGHDPPGLRFDAGALGLQVREFPEQPVGARFVGDMNSVFGVGVFGAFMVSVSFAWSGGGGGLAAPTLSTGLQGVHLLAGYHARLPVGLLAGLLGVLADPELPVLLEEGAGAEGLRGSMLTYSPCLPPGWSR
jgi:hypothetical protein